jgi:ribosomal protein S18 acetylase RimI-like enzyme
MPGFAVLPFSDEHVADAASLLARRHERQVARQQLLSMEHDFRAEVEAAWSRAGASGRAAVADGRLAGYMIGWSRPDDRWGANAWIEAAGHAADDPELVRDLYAALAAEWVERGLTAHYSLVPASDEGLVSAWFRLGFGAQSVNGIVSLAQAETAAVAGVRVREASEDDLDSMLELSTLLTEHHAASPVFTRPWSISDEDVRAFVQEELASPDACDLVAEVDGRIVGVLTVKPTQGYETHAGIASPPGAALLAFAVTMPEVRGRGAGVALTHAGFEWARERGYETMVVDWRETNLLSSRFWPRRGFERTFLRVHRTIV